MTREDRGSKREMIELETQRKQKKDDISREGVRERERVVALKIKTESEH